jgi:hypothetical protein
MIQNNAVLPSKRKASSFGRTLRDKLGDGVAIRREPATGTQQATSELTAAGNHPDKDLFLTLDRLPVESPAGLDPELAPDFGRNRDPVLLGNRRNHGK